MEMRQSAWMHQHPTFFHVGNFTFVPQKMAATSLFKKKKVKVRRDKNIFEIFILDNLFLENSRLC